MQNKKFPFPLIILTGVSVGLMALLIIVAQRDTSTIAPPPLIPTLQVNANDSVGGRPQVTSSRQKSTAPPTANTSTTTTGNTPTSTTKVEQPAPRQDAISQTVTKEYRYKALGSSPNDPYFAGSWSLQHTGATTAWNTSTGSPVTVAVIDTGFALGHEDLSSQWKINTGETGMTLAGSACWTGISQDKSTNGCDDDRNGYVDDWRGWNFVNKTNNPQAGTTQTNGIDAISHGTSVAGLAGAATNNNIGVASYNWNTKIIPLEALNDNGEGTTSSVIAAIYYAVDNGASIINLSLGGPDTDPALQAAIDYAYGKNIVVIAAAGNCGSAGDAGCGGLPAPYMMYPALSNHVIAVGATDSTDTRASFSSYGPGLDVVAPGSGAIVSTLIDSRAAPYNYTNAYSASLYGTSFSSPIVSGIASLIRSLRPDSTVDDITALIDGSATKVAKMNGNVYTDEYGHGLINAGTAATIANALAATPTATPTLGQTGDYRSEHSFSPGATMSSGCTAAASTYCTVHINNTLGYDRYLPYAKTSASGSVGWQWSGSILMNGEWSVHALQGDNISTTPYLLFSK
jgi:subtilisin family serine protease